jgi:hypothetical protein
LTTNYYDVVVIGMELGPLAAGALLAKRGFRVLVVGQNAPTDRYKCFGYTFIRRPFVFTSIESPAVRRVVKELGIGQIFQQIAHAPSPAYQVILPKVRTSVYGNPASTKVEILRELPDAAPYLDDIFESIGRIDCEIDKLLANDLVIPPESFMEKREFARAEVQNPFRSSQSANHRTTMSKGGELFELLNSPVRFETGGASKLPPLVRFRQAAGWLFDCRTVEHGRDGLRSLLVEQIVGHGGDQHPRHRVVEIAVKKGRVTGVRITGREDMTGCEVVLSDLSPRELAPLIPPDTWTKRFRELVEETPEPVCGFAINLGVDPEVVPAGLADTAFVSFGPGLGDELLRVEKIPQENREFAALNVSCVAPPGSEESILKGALRDAMLDRMRWLVPFLDNHLKVIHSPFDGFGPIDLTGKAKGEAPPMPHPEEVQKWLIRTPSGEGVLGIENLPHRAGIKGLLMAGNQVVSGLGAEGEFIAAWGAARIAGRTDPRRERLVRSMRSKVEM